MPLEGEYLGMPVRIDDLDHHNQAFFSYCGQGELRVQQCRSCGLKRVPPTTACPFCAAEAADWVQVSGKGTVHSYGEVHHAIQRIFAEHAPYMLLLVELDEQRGAPGEHDGLRLQGNLALPDGTLAPPDVVATVGIGSRVRVVFSAMGEAIAMPLWTLDEDVEQPVPWRYPIE